eukprot:1951540-Prymnesium_polylepis.1
MTGPVPPHPVVRRRRAPCVGSAMSMLAIPLWSPVPYLAPHCPPVADSLTRALTSQASTDHRPSSTSSGLPVEARLNVPGSKTGSTQLACKTRPVPWVSVRRLWQVDLGLSDSDRNQGRKADVPFRGQELRRLGAQETMPGCGGGDGMCARMSSVDLLAEDSA